ncbi:amidohydrolase family protein [Alteromonas sp. H39]|uniref:amidohydrolase family protein n=1 Tax=Alteromonas sp. H39 TaxID=3389876 RepID=UPI0039E12B3E
MSIIDPHLHLFSLSRGRYDWLKPDNPPFWPEKGTICRDVSEYELNQVTLAGYVHIEAGFDNDRPWREVNWLHGHCRLPVRIVGGINLSADHFFTQLDALSAKRNVVGVRDILDVRAAALLAQPVVRHRLGAIADRGLIFEAQLPLTDAAAVTQLERVLNHQSELMLVINHGGFPPVTTCSSQVRQWEQAMRRLSAYPGVSVKLSGWEMVSDMMNWRQVRRTIATALTYFGSERVMMASNFPLLTFRMNYADYWQRICELIPEDCRDALVRANASRVYRF